MIPPQGLCSSCRGTGKRPLSNPMVDTLQCVQILWANTLEIASADLLKKVKRTALINRLNALVRMRLVERSGSGRDVYWRRT